MIGAYIFAGIVLVAVVVIVVWRTKMSRKDKADQRNQAEATQKRIQDENNRKK
jgi:FtsZ-interacting cell division protein ZipA